MKYLKTFSWRFKNALSSGSAWLLLVAFLLPAACKQTDTRGQLPKGERLLIVTTTGILADAVKNIVGDAADVRAVMGSGVDPHLYKATQGDLQQLTDAHVIIYNGLHLEGKMGEVLHKLSRYKTVLAAAEGIAPDLLRKSAEFNDAYDPHVWFDVKLWRQVVAYLSAELQQKDPQHALLYQQQTARYLQQLDALDKEVRAAIATIPPQQRILITAHDAFGYFGAAYGIQVRGLQGLSTVSEFGLQDVSSLVRYVADNKIRAVFIESSVSPKAIEAVMAGAENEGHRLRLGGTLFSDALGEAGTPEGTYAGMLRHNVKQIVSALK